MKNDEKYTGVSVFFVNEGIDSGDIVLQKKIEIGNKTQEQLITLTKKTGMELISEAVDLIEKKQVKIIKNDDKYKSYYGFPTRKDVVEFLQKGKKFF